MISYCINYFNPNNKECNRKENIEIIIKRLKKASSTLDFEILWNNDSSSDKEEFDKHMKDIKGNVFFSNNLGEFAAYNLLFKNAVGDYIVTLQDDDIPSDYNWMDECINIFNKYVNVGLIGLKNGGPIMHFCPVKIKEFPEARKLNWPDGNDEVKIFYAGWLNTGPFIFKKESLNKIGYFDEKFKILNNPFTSTDADIVVQAWLKDIHVLKYKLNKDFDRGVGGHGSKINENTRKLRVEGLLNSFKCYWIKNIKYKEKIEKKIKELNDRDFKNIILKNRKDY